MKTHIITTLVLALSLSVQAASLPTSKPEKQGIRPDGLAEVHALVSSYVKESKYAGASMMVVRNGYIVDQQAWGHRDLRGRAPVELDTIHHIYSMSKVITSVAALQLVEEERIQLDADITQWIPELKNLQVFTGGTADSPQLTPAKKSITVRMLLNHTSGLTYGFFNSHPVQKIYGRHNLWGSASLDEFIAKVGKLPLMSEPGTQFHYGINLDVLGLLIQRVTEKPFEYVVAERITKPLGMTDTAYHVAESKRHRLSSIHKQSLDGKLIRTKASLGSDPNKGQGFACGGAGMFSTLSDYALLAQALVNGGELNGTRILKESTVKMALENSLTTTSSPYHEFQKGDGWGLFSAIRVDDDLAGEPGTGSVFYWSGAATTHFFGDPEKNLVGLVFCQHFPFDQHGLFGKYRTSVYKALAE